MSSSFTYTLTKAAELTLVAVEILAEVGILRGQRAQHFADSGARHLDRILPVDILAKR
jgi:hypothetical protein